MTLFRDIERKIDERLRRLFRTEPVAGERRELVEIQRTIIDRIEERVQMLTRAKRAFPYNDVAIRIPVPDADRRAAYEMVFVSDDALEDEIREHLRKERIEFPAELQVHVTLVETTELAEPLLACRNRVPEPIAAELPVPQGIVRFTLPAGEIIDVDRTRIHVGRTAEVLDDRRRLVRRNDLVLEGDTVSRAHAHIAFAEGEYRLFDDGSSYGTSAIHEGRLVEVPRAGGRGLRLHSGDEVYFGQARVRFDVLEG